MVNYFAGLGDVEKPAALKVIRHDDLFGLHRILAGKVMDQVKAGRYRTIAVRVGNDVPPNPDEVSGLMFELLDYWNRRSDELSPVLSSAILDYRFEAIPPFRRRQWPHRPDAPSLGTLPPWFRPPHHIFSIDEYYSR